MPNWVIGIVDTKHLGDLVWTLHRDRNKPEYHYFIEIFNLECFVLAYLLYESIQLYILSNING